MAALPTDLFFSGELIDAPDSNAERIQYEPGTIVARLRSVVSLVHSSMMKPRLQIECPTESSSFLPLGFYTVAQVTSREIAPGDPFE
jgi:hypothetical protein